MQVAMISLDAALLNSKSLKVCIILTLPYFADKRLISEPADIQG